ncbi:hypothetical protein BT96DRAFT_982488 [Gymnopus androsaceus JB14]|uniref:Uncharacterized protein n=1 Tax=Gymnopus androsaceus JB14 TaxID=1447944 RepID=A0A6A4GDX1_9AGAR|nr:hypothetical protein BT96DRAFT_982488 [Gymnopus androsaceus JB14]
MAQHPTHHVDKKLFSSTNDMNNLVQNCTTRDNITISAQSATCLSEHLEVLNRHITTHVDDGAGGLHASIQYGLDRPQLMTCSQNVGLGMATSLSDFNNSGVVTLLLGTGPPTVPESQKPLESHIVSLGPGFESTEMILLHEAYARWSQTGRFPSDKPPNISKTPPKMYLSLATRSDFRIFSSDTSVAMQGHLIMWSPIPPKWNLHDDHLMSVTNEINLSVLNPRANSAVTMLWADRQGSFCPSTECSVVSSSTEKFWFEISDNDGSDPVIVDNGGSGFAIEQDSMFVAFKRTKHW